MLSLSSFVQPSHAHLPQPSEGILKQMLCKQLWKAPGAHHNSL